MSGNLFCENSHGQIQSRSTCTERTTQKVLYASVEAWTPIDGRDRTKTAIVHQVTMPDTPIHHTNISESEPMVIKTFFMLNLAEHEIYPAHKLAG